MKFVDKTFWARIEAWRLYFTGDSGNCTKEDHML